MWMIEKKIKKGDYDYAIVRDHPNRTKNDYVLYHRVVMENYLGRLLSSNEVVHHIDGNKKNNHISNLEVMDIKEHNRLHGLDKGLLWCLIKCPTCGKIFEVDKSKGYDNKVSDFKACSKSCGAKFGWRIRKEGMTSEIRSIIENNLVEVFKK